MTVPELTGGDRLTRMENALSARGRRTVRRRRPQSRSGWQRLIAVAIVVVFAVFLTALGLFMVTGPDTARRIIAHAIPTITEEDALLALHGAELQAAAKQANGKPMSLQGFPIAVALPAAVVAGSTPQKVELALTTGAAAAVYDRGLAAFATFGRGGGNESGPLLSPIWTLHHILTLLNARTHARLRQLTLGLGLIELALVAVFCLRSDIYGRLMGLGSACVLASLCAGLASGLAWLFVQFNASANSSPLGVAAWGMLGEATWLMILLDLAGLLCSAALLGTGLLFAFLDREPARGVAQVRVHTAPRPVAARARPTGRPLDRLPRPPDRTN